MFNHYQYTDHEQYPRGPADMAGYWLEDRIFGGVVLFDRGESGKEANSVWFHSGRRAWTHRIWKLLDWQFDAIASFFLHGPEPADPLFDALPDKPAPRTSREEPSSLRMSKFPFFCDIDNFVRHDDWDAMAFHNIYRDPWERKLPDEKRERCVVNTFDYPEEGVLVSKILEDMKTAPRYRAVAPTFPHPLEKPYEELTEEERMARAEAALDFRIERMSPELGTDEEHEPQRAIADTPEENSEEKERNGEDTGNMNRHEGHTADMAETSHDNNTKDAE
ncbi:hypothetical protein K4F52_005562 [Lecanicillium sp. MT-2017a]|nr:hypothetical protein K4F52_005562 [Lecanicillium sp. MT-2017a]